MVHVKSTYANSVFLRFFPLADVRMCTSGKLSCASWNHVAQCRCQVTVQISSLCLHMGEHAQTEAAAPCQTNSMMCPLAPIKLHYPRSHSQMVHCEQATRKNMLYINLGVITLEGYHDWCLLILAVS